MFYTKTQSERLLELFQKKGKLTLPQILKLRIANYKTVIYNLRKKGYKIRCETELVHKKGKITQKRSKYFYDGV